MVKWMSDQQFRLATLAGAFMLVVVMSYFRFCGSATLPAKPPPPAGPTGTQTQLLSQSTASPSVYQGFLDADAALAGVRAPSPDDMAKQLAYRVDESRRVLEPGQPPVEAAGLKLRVERAGDQIVLVIQNLREAQVAYNVVTTPSAGQAACTSVAALPHNAMILAPQGNERRTECVWREGMAIIVTKVETLEVSPLSAWYLGQVPPALVGIDTRIGRGHRGLDTRDKCSSVMSQVVRTGIDRDEIGWRDLADFYARHRCQTYQFPSTYRALKKDHERQIPAVGSAR
jgi:hypothetical protein